MSNIIEEITPKELVEYKTAQLVELLMTKQNISRTEAIKLWYNSKTKKETLDHVEDYITIEKLYHKLISEHKKTNMQKNEEDMLKALLLNCQPLLDYCQEHNLSIDKLKNANIIKLPNMYAFTRPSEFKLPAGAIGLEYDIATQPRALLGVEIKPDGTLDIVPTEYAHELKMDKQV